MAIKHVMVIGAGQMGAGIAQVCAQSNYRVFLNDMNESALMSGMTKIEKNLTRSVEKGRITESEKQEILNRLTPSSTLEDASRYDVVIEAVVENMDVKTDVFQKLDKITPKHTILATNTSALPITEIAAVTNRPEQVIGMHYMNPVPVMKLVEVINGLETDREISKALITWFNHHGKVACECSDAPGFIVNRVARNFYGEALRSVDSYDLKIISEVDQVMREVGGFKMGPFELMDLIGIDVNLSVTESVYKAFFDEPRFKPHRLQKEMVDGKRYGRKTKKGFYNYE